jgi:hypothetical protein
MFGNQLEVVQKAINWLSKNSWQSKLGKRASSTFLKAGKSWVMWRLNAGYVDEAIARYETAKIVDFNMYHKLGKKFARDFCRSCDRLRKVDRT